jgi:dihydrofolate synthase / folylpolyglutamate synthase
MKKGIHQDYQRYYDAIAFLEKIGMTSVPYEKSNLRQVNDPSRFLQRMQDFLDRIGNPEKGFKYVHITGTSGKGSVSNLVHFNLVSAGKKAGLFTSPFVTTTIEKIQVGRNYIDPIEFADIVDELKPHLGSASYFEIIFAIALTYFQKKRCEYAVIEVGLGGRYDATNVIPDPLITAITNIGLDHMQILGPTVRHIATDKSGIIKKASVFVTGEQRPALRELFQRVCRNVGAAKCILLPKSASTDASNRALAARILKELGIIRNVSEIKPSPKLPARFETMSEKPLIVVDGAHNPAKMESTVSNIRARKYRNLVCVATFSADKDWKDMIRQLAHVTDVIYLTSFSVANRKSADPQIVAAYIATSTLKQLRRLYVHVIPDATAAYLAARESVKASDALLVTGSFYLAGIVRALFVPEKTILKKRISW